MSSDHRRSQLLLFGAGFSGRRGKERIRRAKPFSHEWVGQSQSSAKIEGSGEVISHHGVQNRQDWYPATVALNHL